MRTRMDLMVFVTSKEIFLQRIYVYIKTTQNGCTALY